MADLQHISKQVISKKKELDEVSHLLKLEFIGIDNIIDEVIHTISSWYIFPNLQTKPLIVNCWGLTGVAKTALVRRLTHHLKYADRHYEFDFGKGESSAYEIENTLSSVFDNESGYPIVFTFDEFQLSRTINESGNEVNRSNMRFVWEAIDSGMLTTSRSFHSYSNLFSIKSQLAQLIREGVIVKNGMVVKGGEIFRYAMDRTRWQEELRFIPRGSIDDLYEMLSETKSSALEIDKDLLKLDGLQSIDYLNDALNLARSPKKMDLTKSLVFIIGNLDEAFRMSNDITGDTDADQFHRMTKKITISRIKGALQTRFRSEQIARLGNNHIIFPALSKDSFMKIIDMKVSDYFSQLNETFGIPFKYDHSLLIMIYQEGVFPTQGVRPVLSCIDVNLKSKLGMIMSDFFSKKKLADMVNIIVEKGILKAEFSNNGTIVLIVEQQIYAKVQNLKINPKDDMMALIATHEAGHAVLSITLLNVYPEEIFSHSMDDNKQGFTYSNFQFESLPLNLMLNRVAYYLGGIVAEEIIYGKGYKTAGSSSDLEEATAYVAEMIRQCGMGKTMANLQTKSFRTLWQLHDEDSNEEVRVWMEEAKKLAVKTLEDYKPLFLDLSNYLSDNRTIKKVEIMKMVKRSNPKLYKRIDKFESYHGYRDVLKNEISKKPSSLKSLVNMDSVQLNKGN